MKEFIIASFVIIVAGICLSLTEANLIETTILQLLVNGSILAWQLESYKNN